MSQLLSLISGGALETFQTVNKPYTVKITGSNNLGFQNHTTPTVADLRRAIEQNRARSRDNETRVADLEADLHDLDDNKAILRNHKQSQSFGSLPAH